MRNYEMQDAIGVSLGIGALALCIRFWFRVDFKLQRMHERQARVYGTRMADFFYKSPRVARFGAVAGGLVAVLMIVIGATGSFG